MAKISARAAAGLIALVAWLGLAVQFAVVFAGNGSVLQTLVSLLAYFTIITNFFVAAQFTGLAAGRGAFGSPALLGGTVLSIALVGVIYALLLRNLYHLTGGAAFSNLLLHDVTPIAAPLYWVAFAPKGRLASRDPLLWAIYPLAYFVYALARAGLTGVYPYPFMDVARLGWPRTGLNAALIAIGFLSAGRGLVVLDRRLARLASTRFAPEPRA